jgi:hypothetical protein
MKNEQQVNLDKLIQKTQEAHNVYIQLFVEPEKYDSWQKMKLSENFDSLRGFINQILFIFKMSQENEMLIKYGENLKDYPYDMIEKTIKPEYFILIESLNLQNQINNTHESKKIKL